MTTTALNTREESDRVKTSELRKDVSNVIEDVKTLKDDTVEAAKGIAQDAACRVKETASSAKDMARTTGQRAADYHATASKTVSKHPTASILVALGAGALIGRMLWRR